MFELMDPFKWLNRTFNDQLALQMRIALTMFCRVLSIYYGLGDSFLKSSKDFIN